MAVQKCEPVSVSTICLTEGNLQLDCVTFDCLECDFKFERESELLLHQAVHIPRHKAIVREEDHLQQLLRDTFLKSLEGALLRQCESVVGEINDTKQFQCEICHLKFNQFGNMKTHIRRKHTGEKPYECDKCDQTFFIKYEKEKHMAMSHYSNENTINLPYRQDVGCDQLILNINRSRIQLGFLYSFKCDHCDKTFPTKTLLKQHAITHSTERLFECDKCEKTFKTKGILKVHESTHSGLKIFQFDNGVNAIKTESISSMHEFSLGQVVENSFNESISSMHEFSLGQVAENSFKCDKCEKAFKTKGILKAHQLTHSKEKLFECDKCLKAFKTKGILKAHQLTHSGEKLFDCALCGKSFTQKGNLRVHWRVHTGSKPYRCHLCDKSFAQQTGLNVHLRDHINSHGEQHSMCTFADFAK